ncbi:response regulator [Beggiatoa leptomitoformis]|uniref:Sensor protein FixL n=1 Tax=Beggiatoa leptomitoformis TaxID=288004 RepID=A0A2N9YAU1_9GAMM|nr:response regulator [Beggiatoa leptomitoformis]AUI67560.1 response regulator [Beggiatoa leptomitoformis]QGX03535.1 response regulator [Beggiatoa leptomitoformis]
MHYFRISSKLLFLSLVCIFVVLGIGLYSLLQAHSIFKDVDEVYQTTVVVSQVEREAINPIYQIHHNFLYLVQDQSPQSQQLRHSALFSSLKMVDNAFLTWQSQTFHIEEKVIFQEASTAWQSYKEIISQLNNQNNQLQDASYRSTLKESGDNAFQLLSLKINAWLADKLKDVVLVEQNAQQHYYTFFSITFIIILIGILIVSVGNWFVARQIVQPLHLIRDYLDQLKQGKLPAHDIPYIGTDEVADIARALQQLKQGIQSAIQQARFIAAGECNREIKLLSVDDEMGNALQDMTLTLREMVQYVQSITAGNYEHKIVAVSERDELRTALAQMRRTLRQVTDENAIQNWLKTGQTGLASVVRGEQDLLMLTQNIINYITGYVEIPVSVFYVAEQEQLRLYSSYGYKVRHHNYTTFKVGEGLIGQAALERKNIVFSQLAKEHVSLSIVSGLGESLPIHVFAVPLLHEDNLLGALEFATARPFTSTEIKFIELVAPDVAIALNSAKSRLRMKELLDESQQLTQTLQVQQEEVAAREERIRTIVDTVVDAIITIDERGMVDSFNKAAENIFGYRADEVVGHNINMLMPNPYHDEHDRYLHSYVTTQKSRIIGSIREVRGKRKDGSTFPAELSVSEMWVRKQRLFTGVIRDITERKQSEEAIKLQQEELQASNEELQTQQEELRQTNDELENRSRELERQKQVMQEQNTKLADSQRDLERQTRELTLASQYKSEFLANMSHELRTPLNSLLILAGLLIENKDSNLTEKQVSYAKTIESAGQDLLNLINEILDLAKVEAGKLETNIEEVPLVDFLHTTEQKFIHVAEQKGLILQTQLLDPLPQVIHSDIQRLKQIFNNLLSNAFKFTAQGSITTKAYRPSQVELEQAQLSQLSTNSSIAFSVIDTGIGVAQEKQAIIFEAFQQADGTTSRRFGGTGLGLSISRQLAHLLGGELTLQSEENKGSTFTLYLPEKLTLQTNTTTPLSKPKQLPHSTTPTASLNTEEFSNLDGLQRPPQFQDDRQQIKEGDRVLLIVEDDRKFSTILKEIAVEKGFKCLLAEDGKTALQLAETYLPSAIILDVGLPLLDGWTVMERLKDNAITRHIPIHIMSASEQSKDARKLGAIGYLLKPVSMNELSDSFKKIEHFVDKQIKTLLLVEDNPQHQTRILDLVGENNVNTIISQTVEEAYQLLHQKQPDCVIIDVDTDSGNSLKLLEQMDKNDIIVQVPLIIYAERELTETEELIIQEAAEYLTIKEVHSPERLLDEATLFLHQVETQLAPEKQQMLRLVHNKEAILIGKKVLLADDDVRNSFALTTFLESKDMDVLIAENGKEALALLEKNPNISLVLMDVMMPEMDGYEAMQRIRAQTRFRKLPIIALTAKAMKGDKAKCIKAGANDYLTKPVDMNRLLSLLRVWLYQ